MVKQRGNTLIELLLATVIVGVVLTGVAISLTYSIQREALNRYREGATGLAQEVSEYLLLLRAQNNWQAFYAGVQNGADYCYIDSPTAGIALAGGVCPVMTRLGMDFTAAFSIDKPTVVPPTPEKVTANITITWEVDSDPKTYELTQEYYEREY